MSGGERMSSPLVSVSVLNYRQAVYVPHCLEAVARQTYPNVEVIFSDNGSADGSVEWVQAHCPEVRIVAHPANLYYCRAHNIAVAQSKGDYVLTLNVDVRLSDTFVEHMVAALELDPRVGMVSGKLLQMDCDFRPLDPPTLDSTGIWFTPEMRHFDRGQGERDRGQYDRVEYVFGPSGAAALYRRTMLDDLAFDAEYLDEDFVIYREDADLAWRARLLGWRGLYTPQAVAHHIRRVRPGLQPRRGISQDLNMHSVKNRFLMRIKNQTWANALRFLWPTLRRDAQVVGYVLLVERSSLPGLARAVALLPRALARRRHVMRRRRAADRDLAQWFADRPVSFPYPAPAGVRP